MAMVLFDRDLLVAEIGDARPPVGFVNKHAQQSLLAGLEVGFPVHLSLLLPTLPVRCDLVLEEPACRIAKQLVLLVKDLSFHGPLLFPG